MFFYEWLIPLLALFVIGAVAFYIAVRNRVGAGIRTDGRTLHDDFDSQSNRPPHDT